MSTGLSVITSTIFEIIKLFAVIYIFVTPVQVLIVLQIKILNENEDTSTVTVQDFEKADLESCEKERSNFTLPLLSNANDTTITGTSLRITPITPIKLPPCTYQQECEAFKKSLLLPGELTATELAVEFP